MKTDLGIIPFTEFWIDCLFNSRISIMTSKKPNIKYLAYLNDYSYQICELDTGGFTNWATHNMINFLNLNHMEEVSRKYIDKCFTYEIFDFRDKEQGYEKLVELIRQQRLVAVGVDLFYWIPDSYCWNKFHWQHHSLITGFDEENNVFSVLDDNANGFGCFEIPKERFLQATNNHVFKPDAWIVNLVEEEMQFQLTLSEVMFFADKHRKNLEDLDAKALLDLNDREFPIRFWFDLYVKFVHQVTNHQTANALLFKALSDFNIVSNPDLVSGLIQQANDLKIQWRIFEQKIVKLNCLSPDQVDNREFCDECNRLFQQEREMWNTFLAYESI